MAQAPEKRDLNKLKEDSDGEASPSKKSNSDIDTEKEIQEKMEPNQFQSQVQGLRSPSQHTGENQYGMSSSPSTPSQHTGENQDHLSSSAFDQMAAAPHLRKASRILDKTVKLMRQNKNALEAAQNEPGLQKEDEHVSGLAGIVPNQLGLSEAAQTLQVPSLLRAAENVVRTTQKLQEIMSYMRAVEQRLLCINWKLVKALRKASVTMSRAAGHLRRAANIMEEIQSLRGIVKANGYLMHVVRNMEEITVVLLTLKAEMPEVSSLCKAEHMLMNAQCILKQAATPLRAVHFTYLSVKQFPRLLSSLRGDIRTWLSDIDHLGIMAQLEKVHGDAHSQLGQTVPEAEKSWKKIVEMYLEVEHSFEKSEKQEDALKTTSDEMTSFCQSARRCALGNNAEFESYYGQDIHQGCEKQTSLIQMETLTDQCLLCVEGTQRAFRFPITKWDPIRNVFYMH